MPSYNLYIDETGSRHPDKRPDPSRAGRDWFALGGFIIAQEDEDEAKGRHAAFMKSWKITSPLHITDMMSEKKGFAWLGQKTEAAREQFWSDYKKLLSTMPVLGMACVIDRPGYAARGYVEKHKDSKWLLCRSAFDILIERATKHAIYNDRKLNVIFEGDVGINETVKGYFKNLKENGLAFDGETSAKYRPLEKEKFADTLSTIEYKNKQSVMLQIADSYIYSMARNAYDKKFPLYRSLRDSKKIINFGVPQEQISSVGVKHYCFDKRG